MAVSIRQSMQMALDPVHLARAAGLELDEWQASTVRSASMRQLLNCSRQVGKSTTASVKAVHTALYDPGSLTLLLSPSQRQSAELFRSCRNIFSAIDQPVGTETESVLRMELENGSRIVSLPGKEQTIRGMSGVRLLIIDEASRVEDGLYMSVRPMLSTSGGSLIAMSTPYGARGWWHAAWSQQSGWERTQILAEECPRISAQFLEEERRVLGDWWYQQEYCCKFMDAEGASFATRDIERLIKPEVEVWDL